MGKWGIGVGYEGGMRVLIVMIVRVGFGFEAGFEAGFGD